MTTPIETASTRVATAAVAHPALAAPQPPPAPGGNTAPLPPGVRSPGGGDQRP
jgi:hypothetical protein